MVEQYFGSSYRGDPGVPHSGQERFQNIWLGSFTFSAITWFYPHMWQLSNQFNWHDKAMLYEQHHWKKAMEKNKKHDFMWNKMDQDIRESYYRNWPVYFP